MVNGSGKLVCPNGKELNYLYSEPVIENQYN